MTEEEFFALPLLSSWFPLSFSPNAQRWDELSVRCGDCERYVPADRTRGTVRPEGHGYRSGPTCYAVEAYALCPDCDSLTSASYLLHADMSISGVDPRTGRDSRWRGRRSGLLERAWRWLTFVDLRQR